MLIAMKSQEQLKHQVSEEQRLKARLKAAKDHLENAQRERTWAIASAHSEGLSIRKIASATGLSSSRVHQLMAWFNYDNVTQ